MEIDDKQQLKAGRKVGDDVLKQIDYYVMSRQDEVFNILSKNLTSLHKSFKTRNFDKSVENFAPSEHSSTIFRTKKTMRNKVIPQLAEPGV